MFGSKTNAKVSHAEGRNNSDRLRLERRNSSTFATLEEVLPRPRRIGSANKVAVSNRASSLHRRSPESKFGLLLDDDGFVPIGAKQVSISWVMTLPGRAVLQRQGK
jgi:hypothetical protein